MLVVLKTSFHVLYSLSGPSGLLAIRDVSDRTNDPGFVS